jgi:hypothetical protein
MLPDPEKRFLNDICGLGLITEKFHGERKSVRLIRSNEPLERGRIAVL